jgi:hypothetical protein
MGRKRLINKINDDGTITKIEMEIPDDQADMPEVSQQEYDDNQPLIRKQFKDVLKNTYNELNKMNDRINNIESIITQHNELLKTIIKNISK